MSAGRAEGTEQLVEKARDRSVPLHEQHGAFDQLVERFQHLVFSHALSVLRNVEEARDATQDAFTTAWRCLPQIRRPAAFSAWLMKIVATQCCRRIRRRACEWVSVEAQTSIESDPSGSIYHRLVASAVAGLPPGERHVLVLFYYLGYTQEEIALQLGLKSGTVGKRLHSARSRIRRHLPPSVRSECVPLARTRTFIKKVQLGLYDEYVGEYRFEHRPDLIVTITREGESLISESRGQRNALISLDDESLLTTHYDGEGRFRRDRQGRITHFVYYEFGKRLGIARKSPHGQAAPPPGGA